MTVNEELLYGSCSFKSSFMSNSNHAFTRLEHSPMDSYRWQGYRHTARSGRTGRRLWVLVDNVSVVQIVSSLAGTTVCQEVQDKEMGDISMVAWFSREDRVSRREVRRHLRHPTVVKPEFFCGHEDDEKHLASLSSNEFSNGSPASAHDDGDNDGGGSRETESALPPFILRKTYWLLSVDLNYVAQEDQDKEMGDISMVAWFSREDRVSRREVSRHAGRPGPRTSHSQR
ncbi:hypothetical protein BDZ89DRAFT_1039569 [Hymenopellis radicata]|nr:hypothetical protein BDZ89DRAFT_1039569 [Hymenopellis radicata]